MNGVRTWLVGTGLSALLASTGCGASNSPNAGTDSPPPAKAQPSISEQAEGSATATLVGPTISESTNRPVAALPTSFTKPTESPSGQPVLALPNPAPPIGNIPEKYREPFADAATEITPAGQQEPHAKTRAGKVTALINEAVKKKWAGIPLADAETGEPLKLSAVVTTNAGSFTITLRPDLAPNHVRHFIALATEKFYDGLLFEQILRGTTEDITTKKRTDFSFLIGGDPSGTAEEGKGHIGYFMYPEFRDDVSHEVGTVGFWHEGDPVSTGTRIYITTSPAPNMDRLYTIFGKVTAGLEVVEKLGRAPVADAGDDPSSIGRPKQAIVIEKIEILGLPQTK